MSFAVNAVVKDVGRQVRGIAAIKEWANKEIFAVNVTLDVIEVVAEGAGQTIVTVKITALLTAPPFLIRS